MMCGPGVENCYYNSKNCAKSAGWKIEDCCPQPKELGSCGMNIDLVTCGVKSCVYDNACVAELAGFNSANRCGPCADPATCESPVDSSNPSVEQLPTTMSANGDSSGAAGIVTGTAGALLMGAVGAVAAF